MVVYDPDDPHKRRYDVDDGNKSFSRALFLSELFKNPQSSRSLTGQLNLVIHRLLLPVWQVSYSFTFCFPYFNIRLNTHQRSVGSLPHNRVS